MTASADRPHDWPKVRLHVVTGKGGTGKSTVAAALALALATSGRNVLLCEVEGRQGIARMFDVDRPADLAGAPQPAVHEGQLAGGEDQRPRADGWHVGRDGRGDRGQPDAELGEARVPAHAGRLR